MPEPVVPETAAPRLAASGVADEGRLRRAMHALRDPVYRAWFVSQVFSSSGAMAQAVAQSWLILELTGRAIDIGILGAVTWAPTLLGGAWAGAVVDRFDHRRLLIGTQSAFVALAGTLTVLVGTGAVQYWMILAVGALTGAVMAVDGPARQVYVFELVGPGRVASAVGLYEVMLNSARVIGPATGGILLATVGTTWCFALNMVSFVPTLWVLARNRPTKPAPERPARAPLRAREGFAAVWRSPVVRSCILVAAASGTLFNLGTTTPLFAKEVLGVGGGGFGALMACFGLGALPGALMAASARTAPGGRLIRRLTLLAALAILGTASTPVALGAYVGIAATGFCSIWLVAAANTLVQLRSEPHLRGRVMGIWTMALPGTIPVTGMLSALAAEVDPRWGVGLAGVALLGATAATWAPLGRREANPEAAAA